MKEVAVAKVNELKNGQMQQIAVGDSKILLTRINDKFYASGAICTHYGAPLATGVLCGERIVCPWHNACFNAIAGQQEEPPGLDSLPIFSTRVSGEDVLVELPETIPSKRTLTMARYAPDTKEQRTLVVLGAGAAGAAAVEMIRQQGFQGKVILVSKSEKLPYDRTKLSKNYLQGKAEEDSLPLRSCEFYDRYDIELRFGKAVTSVDPGTKTITFEDESTLNYDAILLATGGKPRKLDVPGADLKNIFTIRETEDVNLILAAVKNAKKAVVIGSSFIGMEAAASLTQQDIEVTVVSPSPVPFAKILGEQLGKMFQKVHENHGVKFYQGTKATEFAGDGRVETVILENGEKIAADLVIVGIGVQPNTDYLKEVELAEDRSIPVGEDLQAEVADLYAAGDIARFPYAPMGKSTRIEHWRLAAQQGRIAAKNMLASENHKQTVSDIVPFFWSGQFDLKLRYVGHAEEWDDIVIDGDLERQKFLAFYIKSDRILAVAGIGRDKDIAAISELMRLKQMPPAKEIKDRTINWVDRLTN